MKNLRRSFERFCFQHRNKGIPNLMLYICLGNALVYLLSSIAGNYALYYILSFDRAAILQGQIWRLFTYPLTMMPGNVLIMLIALVCYYSLGRAVENIWGTFRFNLFYLSGVVLMDIFCMIFGGYASVNNLNMSLLLAYATLYPSAQFLIFYIIPVKAWALALFYIAITLLEVLGSGSLFPLVALGNYFLFFGKDVLHVIPMSWQANFRRLFRKGSPKAPAKPKVIPFPNAGSYEATVAKPKAPYTHRCTICGRTDVDHPDLEFRYCSRCKGYHCYCEEHISNHTHIQ